jgi:hypothetical protein
MFFTFTLEKVFNFYIKIFPKICNFFSCELLKRRRSVLDIKLEITAKLVQCLNLYFLCTKRLVAFHTSDKLLFIYTEKLRCILNPVNNDAYKRRFLIAYMLPLLKNKTSLLILNWFITCSSLWFVT